jgi:hypothetical protein
VLHHGDVQQYSGSVAPTSIPRNGGVTGKKRVGRGRGRDHKRRLYVVAVIYGFVYGVSRKCLYDSSRVDISSSRVVDYRDL